MTTDGAPRVIFVHNPRTGGITLRNALRRQFRTAPLYIPRDPATQVTERETRVAARRANPGADEVAITHALQAKNNLARVRDHNLPYVHGLRAAWPDWYTEMPLLQDHIWFGLHEHLPGDSTYITLIRDPVERAVSIYFHHRRAGRIHRSLEEYLRSVDFMRDNGQTLRVSGGSYGFDCPPELLGTAKRNLVGHFAWVGVTERFAESVVLLRRTFGWRPLYFRHQNAAPRTAASRLSPDLVDMVRERNQLDVELHRFALELLQERLAADPGHAAELAQFERMNPAMGHVVGWRTRARDARIRVKGRIASVLGVSGPRETART